MLVTLLLVLEAFSTADRGVSALGDLGTYSYGTSDSIM
jgi:hypothetical protein